MARARTYSQVFRDQMVDLVRSGRTPEALSREFEPAAETIRGWVRAADAAGGGGTSLDQEELKRLRREVAQLREEREILAKAAAWFARETNAKSTRSSRS